MMKKYGCNVLIVLFVGLAATWVFSSKKDLNHLADKLMHVSFKWLILGFLCMGVYWIMETLIQYMLVRKVNSQHPFWNSFKVVMTGNFFNAITPFASGGQPMQMLLMRSQGVPLGISVSILLARFIVYQTVLTVYSSVVLMADLGFFKDNVHGLAYLSLIGYSINLLVVIILFCVTFMEKSLKKATFVVINFLKKIRLVKHDYRIKHRLLKQINNYTRNISLLRTNPKLIIKMVVMTIIQLTAFFFIPYMVYRAFGLNGDKITLLIGAAAFIVMFAAFIPTPGSAGVAEGSFFVFFELFFPAAILPAAMLYWRIITFYCPLVLGGIITALPSIKEKVAEKRGHHISREL